MGLTTILNAKKVARKLLLYNYWPGELRQGFKDVRDDLLFRLTAVQNGLGVNFDSGKAVFSKNKRRIIVPAEILSRKDQALSLAMNFDRIFSIPDLQYSDNTVDFTKEIALMLASLRKLRAAGLRTIVAGSISFENLLTLNGISPRKSH